LQDLTSHRVQLNDGLEIDHLNVRRLPSDIIENIPLRFSSIEHYTQIWQKLFYE